MLTFIQDGVMPVELVDDVDVTGDGLVGHDQDAVGAVDGPDQVQLEPGVRARAVERATRSDSE